MEFDLVGIGIIAGVVVAAIFAIRYLKTAPKETREKITSSVTEISKWIDSVLSLSKQLVAGAESKLEDGIITDEEAKEIVKEAVMEFQKKSELEISEQTVELITEGAFFLLKRFIKDEGLAKPGETDTGAEQPES
ncbi:hypothetical protein [Mesotoga prima]|uniref:hypothetical protein n=1 Tax=Mesotoga prima TaxID=1184387 RepID=UPI002FDAF30A